MTFDWTRAGGRLALALPLTCIAVSVAVFIVSWPMVASVIHRASVASHHHEDAVKIIAWTAGWQGETPLSLTWRAGLMSAKESEHFGDVRRLLKWNRLSACAGFGLAVLASCSWRWALRLQDASRVALWLLLLLGILLTAWASFDWRSCFNALHSILFAQGSWRFPPDSVSVQVFPRVFWKMMLALVFTGAVGMLFLGSSISRTPVTPPKSGG